MRRPWLALVPLIGLLAGSGGDDGDSTGSASTETTTLDPGVTFEDDVTVPTEADGRPDPGATTSTTEPDVVTQPGAVPEEFPRSFPVPEGAEVETGSVGRVAGELRLAVDYTIVDEDPAAVLDFYRDALAEAGFTVLLDDEDGSGQGYIGTLVFETDTYIGNVLVSGDGAHGVLLSLTATLPD